MSEKVPEKTNNEPALTKTEAQEQSVENTEEIQKSTPPPSVTVGKVEKAGVKLPQFEEIPEDDPLYETADDVLGKQGPKDLFIEDAKLGGKDEEVSDKIERLEEVSSELRKGKLAETEKQYQEAFERRNQADTVIDRKGDTAGPKVAEFYNKEKKDAQAELKTAEQEMQKAGTEVRNIDRTIEELEAREELRVMGENQKLKKWQKSEEGELMAETAARAVVGGIVEKLDRTRETKSETVGETKEVFKEQADEEKEEKTKEEKNGIITRKQVPETDPIYQKEREFLRKSSSGDEAFTELELRLCEMDTRWHEGLINENKKLEERLLEIEDKNNEEAQNILRKIKSNSEKADKKLDERDRYLRKAYKQFTHEWILLLENEGSDDRKNFILDEVKEMFAVPEIQEELKKHFGGDLSEFKINNLFSKLADGSISNELLHTITKKHGFPNLSLSMGSSINMVLMCNKTKLMIR